MRRWGRGSTGSPLTWDWSVGPRHRPAGFASGKWIRETAMARKPVFLPGLPVDIPAGLWRGEGHAGMLLLRHPRGPAIFCGLYPDTKPVGENTAPPGPDSRGGNHGGYAPDPRGACREAGCGRDPRRAKRCGQDDLLQAASRRLAGALRRHDARCSRSRRGLPGPPLPTWSAFESGGTRWPCHANRSVPLQALFVLEQAPGDGVEPLAGAKTALIVERACGEALQPFHLFGPDSVPSLGRHIFENAASLAAEVSAFRLRVSLDGRFWEKIDEALESKAGR